MSTYIRKYYLTRMIRKHKMSVSHKNEDKTIKVPSTLAERLKENKYMKELRDKYNYGVQIYIE